MRLAPPLVAPPMLLALACCGGGGGLPPAPAALVAITTSVLPDGATGLPYLGAIEAQGAHPPLVWRIVAGQVPPGVTLDGETGRLEGWPRRPGAFRFRVEVRDGADPSVPRDATFASATQTFDLAVARGALTVLPVELPVAEYAAPYVGRLEAAGGTEPVAFELVDGSLPPGLALDADGRLHGRASEARSPYRCQVRATDALGATAARALALEVVVLPLGVGPASLGDMALGAPVAKTARAFPSGGGAPYAWSVVPADGLPPGVTLDAVTGRLDGTPTALGTRAFRLEVVDGAGQRAGRDYVVRVNPGPVLDAVVPGTLRPDGSAVTLVGSGFQVGMTVSFGGAPAIAAAVTDDAHAAVVPPDVQRSGAVDVRVTNPDGGTYERPNAFRYPLATVAFLADGVVPPAGAPGSSRAVAAGDVDGDGRADLVQAWSAGIQLLRRGNATSAGAWTSVAVRTSGSFNDVKLADVDADGDLDVVALRSSTNESVEVYKNDGRGGFPSTASGTTTYPKPASHFPSSLAVGDVNGDGVVDVAFTSGSGGQGTLFVYRGLGNGAFALEHVAATSIADATNGCFAPNMVVLADHDGDGRDDFALVDAYPNACALGQTCPATLGVANTRPGGDDLVAWIAKAGTTGSPLGWTPVRVSGRYGRLNGDNVGLAAYDHDGDGRLDLAVFGGFHDQRGMGVAFLSGDGAGAFAERFTRPTAYDRRYGARIDANGDGCDDLVVVGGDGRLGAAGAQGWSVAEVYLGGLGQVPAIGWRSGPESTASLPGANPGRVAVGDFDGDGLDDFAVDQSFNTKERFGNDQDDGPIEGVAIFLNRSH